MKPQTCSNLISSFWKKQDKRNKIRNRKGAFLKCGLKKKLVESSPVKQFTLCSCLLFKQLNHPCRGGIKKSLETAFLFTLFFLPSSSLISPVLHPSPKIGLTHFSHFCRAHATSTVLSSLFSPAASLWIILHGSHSLHGLEASDTSVQNTVGTVSNSLFSTEGQTEASHGRAGDFFLTFAFIDKRAAGPHL